jgi:hypothetical protein
MDNRQRAATLENVQAASETAVTAADSQTELLAIRQRETAEYISEMILELRNLARSLQLYKIMIPLEYAYYEAFTAANRVEVPEADRQRLLELSKIGKEMEQVPPARRS